MVAAKRTIPQRHAASLWAPTFASALPLLTSLRTSALALAASLLQAPLREAARRMTTRALRSPQRLCSQASPTVSVGGGGVFFFWQMGAARAVVEALARRRGPHAMWAGSSAGALVGALALCDVSPSRATHLAHALATRERLYERVGGLAGVWGTVVRAWLDALLPVDAAQRCDAALSVHVTLWRGWLMPPTVHRVSRFKDREALIDALMASIHIPWFLDGRLWAPLGEKELAMDGSILRFLPGRQILGIRDEDLDVTTEKGRLPDYFITHTEDDFYEKGGPGFTELIGVDVALAMVERGYEFTKVRLAGEGAEIAVA